MSEPDRRAPYSHLNPAKLRVIDICFEQLGCRTFADLGGIWAVDGGYSRYAADVHAADHGVIVDDDFTEAYLAAAAELPQLDNVRGDFGDSEVINGLPPFEVAFFFDVLLHQAAPDWDEILAAYAARCGALAIVQPQWNGDETIRLLDLGEERYFASVPSLDDTYSGLFDKLDTPHPRRGKLWRDVHDIWQWGITDEGLIATMRELGFEVRYQEITGNWRGKSREFPEFHETAFVFWRP